MGKKLLKTKKGIGNILAILGIAITAAVFIFPLSRWLMTMQGNARMIEENLEKTKNRLEATSVLEDRWRKINDMNIDEFIVATNQTTDYGKFKITEEYSAGTGIYKSNGTCSGTYVDDGENRACRKVTLTVKDADGNVVTSVGPAIRVASPSGGDNLPVGTIISYSGTATDLAKLKKWHICDGTNGTPNLQGRFLEGVTSLSNIKQLKEGGFPNIKGKIGAFDTWLMRKGGHNGISGAFYAGPNLGALNSEGISCGGSDNFIDVYFDASKYNPIFRDDVTTVQPSSYTVVYIMKIKK